MAARSLAGEDLLGQIYGGLICFMVCVSTGWSLVGCRAVDTVIGLSGWSVYCPGKFGVNGGSAC